MKIQAYDRVVIFVSILFLLFLQICIIHIEYPGIVLLSLLFMLFPFRPLEPFFSVIFQPRILFVHQHGADQHIRIDDLVGIIMKPDTVHGFQHPAVLIAYSLRRPYFPPVSRGVLAGLIQAHHAAKCAVAIRKAG